MDAKRLRRFSTEFCEKSLVDALYLLGLVPEDNVPIAELRGYEVAASALRTIQDHLDPDVTAFVNRPLTDYSNQTPKELVAKHGAKALETLANDLICPTPA